MKNYTHTFPGRLPPEALVLLDGGIRAPADIRPFPTSTHGGIEEVNSEDDAGASDK